MKSLSLTFQIRKQGLSTCVVDKGDEQCSFTQAELKDIFSFDFETISTTHQLLKCACNGDYRSVLLKLCSLLHSFALLIKICKAV